MRIRYVVAGGHRLTYRRNSSRDIARRGRFVDAGAPHVILLLRFFSSFMCGTLCCCSDTSIH